jgi:cholesterol transport system auxiliary component
MTPIRPHKLGAVVVALSIAFTLAACGLVPARQALRLYTPDTRISPDPAWPTVTWQLLVARPHADALLDSPRIVVRPQPGELQVYKDARWAQSAPDLLQDALLHGFEDSGRIPGVARHGGGLTGDYALLLDLRRFEADYAGAGVPNAEVEVSAKLVSARDRVVIASRRFHASTAASDASVASVTRAFDTSLGQVTGEIVGWTLGEGQRAAAARPAR